MSRSLPSRLFSDGYLVASLNYNGNVLAELQERLERAQKELQERLERAEKERHQRLQEKELQERLEEKKLVQQELEKEKLLFSNSESINLVENVSDTCTKPFRACEARVNLSSSQNSMKKKYDVDAVGRSFKQGHEARNCRSGGRRSGGQSKDGNPVQRGQVSASCLVQ